MIEVNIMPYIYYPLINLMTILKLYKSPKSCTNLNLTSSGTRLNLYFLCNSHSNFNSFIYTIILREDKGDREGILHTHPIP